MYISWLASKQQYQILSFCEGHVGFQVNACLQPGIRVACLFHLMYSVDDDKSMATEKIEPLPRVMSPVKKPPTEKPAKQRAKGGRTKGRITTPERKLVRKEPVPTQKDEMKKKKGFVAESDIVFCLYILYFFFFSL